MTVKKLHKILGEAISAGHGRTRVSVNKPSFTHPLEEDGCVFIDVLKAEAEWVSVIDDDGGMATDSRGREKHQWLFVLDGGNDPRLDDCQNVKTVATCATGDTNGENDA